MNLAMSIQFLRIDVLGNLLFCGIIICCEGCRDHQMSCRGPINEKDLINEKPLYSCLRTLKLLSSCEKKPETFRLEFERKPNQWLLPATISDLSILSPLLQIYHVEFIQPTPGDLSVCYYKITVFLFFIVFKCWWCCFPI